ncbi:hypothetical protein CPB85DRAFT_1224365 [Mucidula mucida]|nr:hypothetical protein CPB85DRAFT_1224365 [Mucidula mucida]
MPIPSSPTTLAATHSIKRARPKGLWKARAILSAPRCVVPDRKRADSDTDHDHDFDEFESISSSHSSRKRKRRNSFTSTASSDDDAEEVFQWDFARRQTCRLDHQLPERESGWTRRQRIMDTTSTAFVGSQTELKTGCDLEDWMDLKDLFAKAAEQYEIGGPNDALPLLRGVVHECHSFLNFYDDPSVLFSGPRESPCNPHLSTPAEERPKPDWQETAKHRCTCVELPTAFHAILGTALFLFGNLIDQDPCLALPGEPESPIPYWLAALDVFETGENLPSRVYGTGCDAPEDWRMAIVWGRTLVALGDATISQFRDDPKCVAAFCADEQPWPSESPFAAIALRRPALTRRMLLSKATPNDLMVLAMDQFSRGIFHMPHPQHISRPHSSADVTMKPPSASASSLEAFSRPKELYTIASEVMLLSEKLPHASERQFWASWADSVLNQMKMEADMNAWRGIISRARGKCWLIAGTACADELEEKLQQGEEDVLDSEDAEDSRIDLGKAIEFLEKGRSDDREEDEERRKQLAEALATLGNLTVDEELREALYRRSEEEGGLSLDLMDVDE